MAAGDAERFMNRRVVVQIVEDAVAPHIAPAIGAKESLDGFLGMLVVDVDGLLVEQKRQRVVRDEAVVLKGEGGRTNQGNFRWRWHLRFYKCWRSPTRTSCISWS